MPLPRCHLNSISNYTLWISPINREWPTDKEKWGRGRTWCLWLCWWQWWFSHGRTTTPPCSLAPPAPNTVRPKGTSSALPSQDRRGREKSIGATYSTQNLRSRSEILSLGVYKPRKLIRTQHKIQKKKQFQCLSPITTKNTDMDSYKNWQQLLPQICGIASKTDRPLAEATDRPLAEVWASTTSPCIRGPSTSQSTHTHLGMLIKGIRVLSQRNWDEELLPGSCSL